MDAEKGNGWKAVRWGARRDQRWRNGIGKNDNDDWDNRVQFPEANADCRAFCFIRAMVYWNLSCYWTWTTGLPEISKKDYDIEAISAAPIVLTTYGHVTYSETKKKLLHQIKWDRVVCDEAHHMQVVAIHVFRGVRMLSASIRWLLTGTPIQNKKNDFYALLTVWGFDKPVQRRRNENCRKNMVLKRTKEEAGVCQKKRKNLQSGMGKRSRKEVGKDVHSRLTFSSYIQNESCGLWWQRACNVATSSSSLRDARIDCSGISQAMKAIDEGIADDEEDEDIEETEFSAIIKKQQKIELMKIVDHIVKIHDAGISSKIEAVYEQLKKTKKTANER